MSDDFQKKVLGALSNLQAGQDDLKQDVSWLKRVLDDAGKRGSGRHTPPPEFTKRRGPLRWAPVAAVATAGSKAREHPTSVMAGLAIIGLGAIVLFGPGRDEGNGRQVVAGPTVTRTTAIPTDPITTPPATSTPTGQTSGPARAGNGDGVEPGSEPEGAQVAQRQTRGPGQAESDPPAAEPPTRPTEGQSPPEPTTRQPGPTTAQDCAARAELLGISVRVLCS